MNSSSHESVDVLIIGAGLSGIGGACQLRRNSPKRSFAIFESRAVSGGTWDLFRYPGIRSDSDMYTLSYGFKPWQHKSAIAHGSSILDYIREAAKEYDVERHIRYQHEVVTADWSNEKKRWHVTATRGDTGESITISCLFILSCSGYYDYDKGYTPEFAGRDNFKGEVIHTQHWPEDLDYKDKRVVVIGSGATAVTLIPEMSQETRSMTMLQRSPTYIANVPERDAMAEMLRKWLPVSLVFRLTRWKRVLFQRYIYQLSRRKPKQLRHFLLNKVREELGPDYDVAKHFTPSYNPWDQRLCAVPEGDMFKAIREGRADVVTDHIENFNSDGIRLQSGQQLDADLIILATGLNLKFGGGVQYSVGGETIDFSQHYVYRGMMFSDIPNLGFVVGYTNSSWTLKADLTSNYMCRLLNRMQRTGYESVTPRVKAGIVDTPLMDFEAGYVLRSREQFPKQGDRFPWRVYQDYIRDFFSLGYGSLKDDELEFR
ncbi:NAD(P)/FAD-dependent oxidoreductase [Halieaceae bacterium IMCC14734]|uniref:NAD(P)/FAD-dependent oxidoreductase n=1 Tax=Candidatus Litorirhabdus singularis TaxID=2518993 RepID=A0ABT3TKT0_9GAMM|nr:NAD(P)/FAD-dependent oxidoreductase [Candidatus Litorirhabdus singularis]MCX2982931.1 NAD(P)/FAD-dependent oxidoreductase [Candidatus Litorirhabdus singularis]